MARLRKDLFTSVRIEGALISPDLLERIVARPEEMEGLTPADYHLAGGERLNEVISRSWNRLTTLWKGFQETRNRLAEHDWGTGMTRDRWLLPLFQELGYGRLMPSKAQEIRDKSYPISHAWLNSPLHLLGCRIPLGHRSPGVAGAATMSPHSLVQEYLNRSENHLWGMVSNGLILRILRDNASIARQAYIEFDLEAIMEGELYSDFVLLWLLAHQSRYEAEKPADCWLERWSQTAQEEGSRVLDRLRDGVKETITNLGQGFLENPANSWLRESLHSGRITTADYFRQLLRLVYRLIFLCTAEDRDLLFPEGTPVEIRQRYERYYSMRRLRDVAEKRRGSTHNDIFQQVKLVMTCLGHPNGGMALGLPALGSFLWSERAVPDLMHYEVNNQFFLTALRQLSLHQTGERRIRVDFRHLGAEEMGSVYESLLELHPELQLEARKFELREAAGNERKTTGSYYTPTSLINCLLDSALEPLIAERASAENPEEALLRLKVCDPACGSGQFLVGAARRIAYRLAMVRSGEDEPTPDYYRPALRQVIARCIYGVDINEMAVELCKINLWLESLEPGMPLCFLDHHIQVGNSLLGVTPALLEKGIPDEAFIAIEGDSRSTVTVLKKQNREERDGEGFLFYPEGLDDFTDISRSLQQINYLTEDNLQDQTEKERRYSDLRSSAYYRHLRLRADAWCAAFVWIKDYERVPFALTQRILQDLELNPASVDLEVISEISRLARQYRFFYWHLAFPDVFFPADDGEPVENVAGWSGGFDLVLSNPPWERIKLQEKEWFASRVPEIAQAPNAAARRRLIAVLGQEHPEVMEAFLADRRQAEGESHLVRNNGFYPLCGRGDINTYAVFAELMKNLINEAGRVGCIVPSGIATDDTTKFFFQELMESRALVSLYDFENRAKIFPAVDSRMKFCLLTLTGSARPVQMGADFCFFAWRVEDLDEAERRFTLSADDLILLNPNTRTCPVFRTRRDAELTKAIYRRVPVLIDENREEGNPWGIRFSTMFHMSNDSHLFRTRRQLEDEGFRLKGNIFELPEIDEDGENGLESEHQKRYLPLYEAKMVHHFDHRFGSYRDVAGDSASTQLPTPTADEYADPNYVPLPRYWVNEREVAARISNVPRNLAKAWLEWDEDDVYKALNQWLAGYLVNHEVSRIPKGRLFKKLNRLTNGDERAQALERQFPLENKEIKAIAGYDSVYQAAEYLVRSRCPRWLLGFRDITNTTNERTTIAAVIPAVGVGHTLPLIITQYDNSRCLLLTANLLTFPLDFVARFKIGGTHLTYFYLKQFPILTWDAYQRQCTWTAAMRISQWLIPRILELTYTSWDLGSFARDCGYDGPPFKWDGERRFLIRCEIDAAYFHLYGLARDDVDYIMETFPIVKRKDEEKYGNYRTKETILAIYDQLQAAISSGESYQTTLNIPSGMTET